MVSLLGSVLLLATIGIAGSSPSCYGGINGDPPLCSTCSGNCTVSSGCKCTTSLSSCLPDPHTCPMNSSSCCLSNHSWYPDLACCIEEPYCTPACFADEECTYVNNYAACVANTTYYQNLGLSVYNVSTMIDCKGANMTVSVGKNLLETLHYNPSALTLSQYNCTGAVVNTLNGQRVYSFTVQTKDGLCGNTMTKNVTHVTFANTVNIPGQNSNGVITAGNISMQFSCTYNITMETSLYTVFKPVMTSQNLNTGGVAGDAGTTLAAYVNPSYTQPLQQSQQDDLSIGSTLYFGMMTQFPDPAFVLRVDQCFATPTSDGSGAIKVQLIQGGCAVGDGPYTQVVENGISKEVRFSITAFAFQDYTTVYIFCDARLCYTPAGSCSKCSSSREATQESVQFGLGPFSFQDILDDSASSQNGLSVTMLLGSLLCLWMHLFKW
ncbi:uromodulin-like [Ranitomeya variabilis]|uniref:uromodulin-like n=1 Tax=Ranitomeya variabilis TaxID=490064 RepID=UPI0040567D68